MAVSLWPELMPVTVCYAAAQTERRLIGSEIELVTGKARPGAVFPDPQSQVRFEGSSQISRTAYDPAVRNS